MPIISDYDYEPSEYFSNFKLIKKNYEIIKTKLPFIFICNPKCASKSVCRSFGIPKGHAADPKFYHMSLNDIRKYYSLNNLSKYFKFSIVRNPFDRLVSLYHDFYYLREGNKKTFLKIGRNEFWPNSIYYKSKGDFNIYCDLLYNSSKWRNEIHHRPQVKNITSYNSNLKLDFIARYEKLNEDWDIIKSKLDINIDLIKINSSKRGRNYKNYYNENSKKLVNKIYEEDLDTFKYKF